MRILAATLIVLLPLADLLWNLLHRNVGLVDFYGLAAFSRNFAVSQVWPGTPYFPPGYPMLLAPGGLLGDVLAMGYLLSCLGLVIALWALYRLTRQWDLSRGVGITVVVLAWISPVYRVVAGSPSVDAMYTGLGLWFIAAAIALWRLGNKPSEATQVTAGWVRYGLVIPALLLPLLRYHALILLLPVLVILVFWRRNRLHLLSVAAMAVVLAVAFNSLTYYRTFGELPASVAALQVRTGIEIEHHVMYPTSDALFADYVEFCNHARRTSLTEDYPPALLARNTVGNLIKFLRRAPVALALVLTLVLLAIRRKNQVHAPLAAAWIVCYCLALSVAYYTPRGALLPVLVGIALCFAVGRALAGEARLKVVIPVVACLLLLGFGVSARYAKLIYDERMHFAGLSRQVEGYVEQSGCLRSEVLVSAWRVVPLKDNPWCEPYTSLDMSWVDDPEIRRLQRRGLDSIPPLMLINSGHEIQLLLLSPLHPKTEDAGLLKDSDMWEQVASIDELTVYRRVATGPSGVLVD